MFRPKSNVGFPPSRRDFLGKLLAAPLATAADRKFFKTLCCLGREDNLQSRLAADPLRPQFHLLPAKNWMNDPNGPIFWNGVYHMFFQHNPNAAVWGDMHWAHAVSPDMIHWKHLPIALAPTPGWDDADGCFTGSAVDDHGTATFLYTGVKKSTPEMATLRDGHSNLREVQCLATSSDPELRTWSKWKTPVIEPPLDPLLTGFRDPFLWRDGDLWYLGVGSGIRKQGGRVLLYGSKDLRQWEYLHPLAAGKWTERENINPVDSGEMWECPDFFPLGSKHVLLYSTAGRVAWETGELDRKELVFHPQRSGVLDHGAYYAQKTQLDRKGNRILWGWIPEKRPDSELVAAGWAGCMALPRLLSLNKQDDLEMRFLPEVASIAGTKFTVPPPQLRPPAEPVARALESIQFENLAGRINCTILPGNFEFALIDDSGLWLSMELRPNYDSSATMSVNGITAAIAVERDELLELDLLFDASVAELISNHQHAFTARIYRKPKGPLRIEVSQALFRRIEGLEAWQMRAISLDRLTV